MPDQPTSRQQKSIAMRVAELEDKLSKIHITEEEMKAYRKVVSLLGRAPGGAPSFACMLYRCFRCFLCAPVCRPLCICICPCGPGVCNPCASCLPTKGSGEGSTRGGFESLGR